MLRTLCDTTETGIVQRRHRSRWRELSLFCRAILAASLKRYSCSPELFSSLDPCSKPQVD